MNFKKIFGWKLKKAHSEETTKQALQKLCETENILFKKQEYLEKKIEGELLLAKKHGTSNKRLALQALRRKKQYEKQLEQLDGSLNTIQHQKHTLENASMNAEVLQTLGSTAKTIKNAYSEVKVGNIHDLLDVITEQQEMANEISQAISNPIGSHFDSEADLLAELEDLENEGLDARFLDTEASLNGLSKLTSRTKTSKSKVTDEDKKLAQLAAWSQS